MYLFIAAFALFARTVHTAKAKRSKTNKPIQRVRERQRERERSGNTINLKSNYARHLISKTAAETEPAAAAELVVDIVERESK